MATVAPVSFETVREEERAHVAPTARTPASLAAAPSRAIAPAAAPAGIAPAAKAPIGLAFSGGGIRSATFCLGVLQALALKGKLRSFDYLSTVSGGGYIGSWFSAWVHRKGFTVVETALKQSAATGCQDPAEVQWLRRYSNYLTPRVGMLSTDALTVVATWLRNVFLNALIMVALIGAVHFAVVAVLPGVDSLIDKPARAGYAALLLASVALAAVAWNLTIQYRREKAKDAGAHAQPTAPAGTSHDANAELTPQWVLAFVVVPLMAAAAVGAIWLLTNQFHTGDSLKYAKVVFGVLVVILAVATRLAHRHNRHAPRMRTGHSAKALATRVWQGFKDVVTYVFAGSAALATGAGLCYLLATRWPQDPVLTRVPPDPVPAVVVVPIITFGPALVLLIFGICISLWIGLVGRAYREDSREWWSRLGGWLMFMAICWLALMLLTFYIPPWIAAAYYLGPAWAKAIAGSAWVASIPTALKVMGTISHPKQSNTRLKAIVINIAITVFAVGIFVMIAVGVGGLINYFSGQPYPVPEVFALKLSVADYLEAFHTSLDALRQQEVAGWSVAGVCAATGLVAALLLAWRVDINRFSLHNMYKNRLIRCYLGASNEARDAQPFTGFDREDDLALKDLTTTRTGETQRPFHIINTAMNLVQGADLAWQERKAASFVLTPKYCGFQLGKSQGNSNPQLNQPELLAFRPTAQYAAKDASGEDRGFSLGMAMATSGAAISPNQGYHSQPFLAVLMTFLNLRLGRWSPNPATDAWEKASPKLGLAYLLAELMGDTNESRDFVYLSDGGHFENMGVYELVRRKCGVIVAVDSGADPKRAFDDLGNMIRKCRIDFGVEIEIDLTNLFGEGPANLSAGTYGIGTIYYNKHDPAAPQGKLIYIKPSLRNARKDAVDLLNYKTGDNSFPQQSTGDQWFDESQFESYRKLGFEIGCDCVDKDGHLLP